MRPTSPAQVEATAARRAAPMEEIREGIWAIAQPFDSRSVVYTLDYVVEDAGGDVHLIDPGADSADNFAALDAALASIGHRLEDVATVTVTHLHHDHLGMAERVRSASGAAVAIHAAEQAALDHHQAPFWANPEAIESFGVPPDRAGELIEVVHRAESRLRIRADALLEHDDVLPVPGRSLRVLHTPGHTVGHICIASDELLFTGDHVLPNQFPGIGLGGDRGTNPLRDMLESLTMVAALDHLEACPGHGWRFEGIASRCEQSIAHHARRTSEVAGVLERSPEASVWQIASQLTWTAGWQNLSGFPLGSALGQAFMHRELLRGT